MKTLIVYTTKYGATEECARRMQKRLPGTTDLVNLDAGAVPDLSPYTHVVVGCSVYMGKPRKAAKQFCERHMNELLTKRVGLYLCCIQDLDKQVSQQMQMAFPKDLIDKAAVLGTLGGLVDFTKLKTFDKFIMSIVAGDLRKKTGGDIVSTLSDERIARFCDLLITGK